MNLNEFYRWSKKEISDFYYHNEEERKSTVVMTKYNTRTYQVDELDWKVTPGSLPKFNWKSADGTKQFTDMIEYFQYKYKINLKHDAN